MSESVEREGGTGSYSSHTYDTIHCDHQNPKVNTHTHIQCKYWMKCLCGDWTLRRACLFYDSVQPESIGGDTSTETTAAGTGELFPSVLHHQKTKHLKHYGPLSRQLASALCTDCTPGLTLRGVSQTARVLHALRVWWESSWPLCSHTFSGLSGWFKLLFVFQPSTGNASGRRKREAPKPQVSTSCTRVGYSYLVGTRILVPTKIWMRIHWA